MRFIIVFVVVFFAASIVRGQVIIYPEGLVKVMASTSKDNIEHLGEVRFVDKPGIDGSLSWPIVRVKKYYFYPIIDKGLVVYLVRE